MTPEVRTSLATRNQREKKKKNKINEGAPSLIHSLSYIF
jgi:hypothetical protein